MTNFQICIPSRSRSKVQKTIYNLSGNLWPNIIIVVPQEQYNDYRSNVPMDISVLPTDGNGIGPARQFILRLKSTGKVIMSDDDLTFYQRSDNGEKFFPINRSATEQMIAGMVDYLDRYCYVGLADKFMSHTLPRGYKECARVNDIYGINRDLLPQPWPEFRLSHAEEHDFQLQLLTRGFKTAALTEYSKTNKVNAHGGCSDWRTTEHVLKIQQQMLTYWPDIVSLVPKPDHLSQYRLKYNWQKAKRIGGIV